MTGRVRTRPKQRKLEGVKQKPTPETETQIVFRELGLDDSVIPDVPADGKPDDVARTLAQKCSQRLALEYILRMVHKMHMRGATNLQISQAFNVSLRTVSKWMQQLRNRYKDEVARVNTLEFMGTSMAFYNEIIMTAMKEFQSTPRYVEQREIRPDGTVTSRKVVDGNAGAYRSKMLNTALKAKNDMHTFMEMAGFFDHAKLVALDDSEGARDMDLGELVSHIIAGDQDAMDQLLIEQDEEAVADDNPIFV